MRPTEGGGGGDATEAIAVGVVVVIVGGGTIATTVGSSNAGPVLAFVGALLVALITWYATDRRQKRLIADSRAQLDKRLEAEEERHKADLAAQEKRHAAQLAHDRSLRDRDHLRVVFENAMRAYEEAGVVVIRLRAHDVIAIEQINEAKLAIASQLSTMRLRFRENHPILENFHSAVSATVHELQMLEQTDRPRAGEAWEDFELLSRAARRTYGEFVRLAVELVGVSVEPAKIAGERIDAADVSPSRSTKDGGP